MKATRRSVLCGALAAGAAPFVGLRTAFAAGPATDALVVIWLRGGCDTLSAVPPVGEAAYALARPTLAVPVSKAIPLQGVFGLHPDLAPLKKHWDAGRFGIVCAAGSPSPTRSHFDAARLIEGGVFSGGVSTTGWIDRLLQVGAGASAFQGVSCGGQLPDSMMGETPKLAISSLTDFGLNLWSGYQPQFTSAMGAMSAGLTHPVAVSGTTTLTALGTVATLQAAGATPANGAVYPAGDLGQSLSDVARLVRGNVGLKVATIDVNDWDMHADLGAHGGVDGGSMHTRLSELGSALDAFVTDLGTSIADVTVVVMSEFGRRVEENGSGGVDHGHGTAMMLLGGGVRGGQVLGTWPGLADAQLDDGDLAVTTDYRTVLGEVISDRLGAGAALGSIFPGGPSSSAWLNVTNARA